MNASEKLEHVAYLKALGAAIKARRNEMGWTLRHMVVARGFHLSAWQAHEAGRSGMSLATLLRIAKALDLPAGQLLTEADNRLKAEPGLQPIAPLQSS